MFAQWYENSLKSLCVLGLIFGFVVTTLAVTYMLIPLSEFLLWVVSIILLLISVAIMIVIFQSGN